MAEATTMGVKGIAWRKEYWLALAAAGVLMALPLGWLSFLLLLCIPGFSAYVLAREKYNIVELVTLSLTFSLVLFALTTAVTVAEGFHGAPYLLGALAVVAALYRYYRNTPVSLDLHGWPVLVLALALFAIVFGILCTDSFFYKDGALYVQPTHACDSVFHLSIIQRYVATPQVPPLEPFMAGYSITYNWLGFVAIGELVFVTGVDLFLAYKLVVALVSALIFLAVFLLAAAAFRNRPKAALVAAVVFVTGAGLSWAYMLYQLWHGTTPDVFYDLVYNWQGVMTLKYDPVSLYFFLPQPQTFALLFMIAGMFTYYVTCRDRSWVFAAMSGLTLAALIMFHMMSAFATLVPLGFYFLYVMFRNAKPIIEKRDVRYVVMTALPLAVCFVAGLYQLSLLTENASSQVVLGHDPDVYTTMLVALGVLIPFALYGVWRLRKEEGAAMLIIFGIMNFLFINVLELPRSMDTYRFLVFLSLPLAVFAGYAFWELLVSGATWKKALAALAILLIVPSALITAAYYTGQPYQQAPADDVSALQWIKANTPASAVIFENPTAFPRVSLVSGRAVFYTGIYMDQFHGIDMQWQAQQIMGTTDPAQLHTELVEYNVSYVFLGSQEMTAAFAAPLQNTTYFLQVYGTDDGNTKVYLVL